MSETSAETRLISLLGSIQLELKVYWYNYGYNFPSKQRHDRLYSAPPPPLMDRRRGSTGGRPGASSPPLRGAAISSKFLRQDSYSLPALRDEPLPPEPRRHRGEAGVRTRPPEGSHFPPKPPIFSLSLSPTVSLSSLSLPSPLSPRLSPAAPSPQSWIWR